MNRPKSILKYKPEINLSTPLSQPLPQSNWFSRLQSKLYTHAPLNDEDSEEYIKSLTLPKQDLRKVTFSVDKLTTEHPFCSTDSPRDEEFEKMKQIAATLKEDIDLAGHYEHACIQREEGTMDRFRNILRANRISQLQSIDLSEQSILTHQAGPLSDIFILKFGLKYLNLSSCKMEDETIRMLLCSLLVSNTVERLNLSNNNFKFKGYKYIAIFIKESKTIKSVDLSHCKIDRRGMQYLSRGIRYASSLHKLVLDDCNTNTKSTADVFEVFSEGVYHSTSLSQLSLCRNQQLLISPLAATWMANLIIDAHKKSSGIVDLDLSGNDLGLMISPLANALRQNTCLRHLNLLNCKITHEGLSFLSNALAENTCLESLDLSNNPLSGDTDEGIWALKTALARNNSLQSLNLSNTLLDSSTAIALAEALPENSSLSRLDLSKNPGIEMAGILALAISIKMNHVLTFLDINIPPGDEDLANLQNDIVAVCTTNMLQKVEAQQKEHDVTLSPSYSSSSSNSSTLEMPSEDMLLSSKQVLDTLPPITDTTTA